MVDQYITEYYGRSQESGFEFVYSINNHPKNDIEFKLHNHDSFYEIYLFLSGNVQFHIEGNIYQAHPHDIFIARPYEMHHNVFLSSEKYERIILFINLDFFQKHHCPELERFFTQHRLGWDCQIPANIANRELFPLLMKINRYLKEGAHQIALCTLMEFLYELNQIHEPLTVPTTKNQQISEILLYINEHLTSELTLDHLADKFYINKYHLCRTFKAITGYTINKYINHKRLLLAIELHKKGQSLLEASANAGYNNYAHFYRMYKSEFGISPFSSQKNHQYFS